MRIFPIELVELIMLLNHYQKSKKSFIKEEENINNMCLIGFKIEYCNDKQKI